MLNIRQRISNLQLTNMLLLIIVIKETRILLVNCKLERKKCNDMSCWYQNISCLNDLSSKSNTYPISLFSRAKWKHQVLKQNFVLQHSLSFTTTFQVPVYISDTSSMLSVPADAQIHKYKIKSN